MFQFPLVAVPLAASEFSRLGFDWLYHLTPMARLGTIVQSVTGRPGMWTDCQVRLLATSGFSGLRRLFRDYSVVDFELRLDARGSYTYFFCGEPSRWGMFKNFSVVRERPFVDHGLGAIRIRPADLLARYDGPLFYRADDQALVIRGGYEGPGQAEPLPANAEVRNG